MPRFQTFRARYAAVLLALPSLAAAQSTSGRIIESHSWSDPEGRLMGYYSAALAFSPLGAVTAGPTGAFTAGLELSFLPPLSEAQRSGGFQKAESTNLSPVLPRPRVSLSVAGFLVEGSWVPPVKAFGVTANLASVSIARTVATARGIAITPRFAASTGHVTAPITCNSQMQRNGGGDSIFYSYICNNQQSADRFEPSAVSGELIVARAPDESRTLAPYVGVGVRDEHNRFNVGVHTESGTISAAHPILAADFTRGYGFAGAEWRGPRRTSVATELFYAPRSLLTVRLLGRYNLGAR
jgi:hypothetical protein